jgi:hypothetical protein
VICRMVSRCRTIMDTAWISLHKNHNGLGHVDRNKRLESAAAARLPRTTAVSASDGSEKFLRRQNRKNVGNVIAFVSGDEAVYRNPASAGKVGNTGSTSFLRSTISAGAGCGRSRFQNPLSPPLAKGAKVDSIPRAKHQALRYLLNHVRQRAQASVAEFSR